MNENNMLFSHESDIDGLGCVVLGKLAFPNLDYCLVPNVEVLESYIRNDIETKKLDNYDHVYITDLALYDPALTMIAESSLKDKVQVLDHHQRAIDDGMNRYPFTKIIEKDVNGKTCGTRLFYEYLVQHHLLNSNEAIMEFVELTRLEDTWEWKQAGNIGIKAHDLAILLNSTSKEKYIATCISKLENHTSSFVLDEQELTCIQKKKEEYKEVLQSMISSVEYFIDEKQNQYGIVFADYEYRNELADYIIKNNNPKKIQYLIIVAYNKGEFGQKSYRSIEKDFDVNEIAMMHGGGGHIGAASVNITEEQKVKALTLPKNEALKYLADSKYTI